MADHYNNAVVPPRAVETAVDLTQDATFYVLGTGGQGPMDIVLEGFEFEVIQ